MPDFSEAPELLHGIATEPCEFQEELQPETEMRRLSIEEHCWSRSCDVQCSGLEILPHGFEPEFLATWARGPERAGNQHAARAQN